ncbi:unnamed protein product [Oppiella nova]|uniref:VWFA domain-containing protein n=1 Tax=Oppiella nova TaxID=334625 RepID=A0A7R9R0Q1_9ACAR|nr:unnamed protein product [Oppiella nova]CAG2182712.1 unnamed protein product [Oppiella nova]
MSRNSKEGIVLAMDCAKTMRDECRRGDRSVFEVSAQCLRNIVRQKIFAETKNEYLLMRFSASDGVRVVPQKGGLMCPPNFHLLRHLMNDLSDVTRVTSDPISVMDALDEAIKQLVEYTRLKKLSDKKIALLTNFGHFDDKDMHRFDTDIGKRLRQLGIKLIII